MATDWWIRSLWVDVYILRNSKQENGSWSLLMYDFQVLLLPKVSYFWRGPIWQKTMKWLFNIGLENQNKNRLDRISLTRARNWWRKRTDLTWLDLVPRFSGLAWACLFPEKEKEENTIHDANRFFFPQSVFLSVRSLSLSLFSADFFSLSLSLSITLSLLPSSSSCFSFNPARSFVCSQPVADFIPKETKFQREVTWNWRKIK